MQFILEIEQISTTQASNTSQNNFGRFADRILFNAYNNKSLLQYTWALDNEQLTTTASGVYRVGDAFNFLKSGVVKPTYPSTIHKNPPCINWQTADWFNNLNIGI